MTSARPVSELHHRDRAATARTTLPVQPARVDMSIWIALVQALYGKCAITRL
jgi:hypothetical protein